MLDIKWIREHADEVQQAADDKRINLRVSELVELDDERKRLILQTDRLREARNAASRTIGKLMQEGNADAANAVREENAAMLAELDSLQPKLAAVEQQWSQLMLLVPNVVSPATPRGASDADNVQVRQAGEPPAFDFEPKSHVQLGELHGLIDLARGVKTAGTRQYYLRGAGVLLHRAVQQLALDVLLEKGFTPLEVPLAVREETMVNTGFFPLGADQTYRIADEDRLLVGTSEVPLISYFSGEVVDVSEPIRLAAASLCFRSEVGSAGRDVHGLYRVHQFAKVEQVVLCEADPSVSERILHEITAHAEHILSLLELPYRVMAVCTGDMSQKTYQQFDIETWMPSRDAYGETHSSSNVHDFQARRSNIRYRGADGKLHYCHTLNNTAVASPRILIPLLENHQQADGSIRIPAALQPYMGGMKRLAPPVAIDDASTAETRE
ncbi:serine--tRNA ligase [Paenibacillus sp. CCS19]|uniref:serine--tRNA ligase n=1 Tax=Paenibacillus sp. CCS19 TaxID=3158387 RepID=UPI00256BC907|nr:serine--tRNA ligase [Paenibacillus cellulosilyticus]GMK40987.1 serine--tRNA ligase [Paenibacillus cellulosilyticus]